MKLARGLLPALFLPALCAAFPFPGSYYMPASSPTLLKATNVGTAGGNVTITSTGATFDSPSVQFIASGSNGPWLMCGVGSTCTVVSTSTSQVVVNFPATTCGTSTCNYDALLCNRDGSCAFSSQLLTVTSSSTPSTILTTRLFGWYDANHDANAGCAGNTTGWTDRSGSGNVPTTLTGVTHNCASSNFNNQPTWSCNGTSSSSLISSFNLGGAGNHTVWMMMAVRLGAAGTNPTLWTNISPTLIGNVSTGIPNTQLNGNAVWSSSIVGSSVSVMSYALGLTSTTETLGTSVNGQTAITASGTGTWPLNGNAMAWCSQVSGGAPTSPYAQEEIAEVIVANAVPTLSETAQLAEYLNLKFQLAPAPQYTASTNVASTSAGAQSWRVTGANFVSGMTAAVSHSNVNIGTVTTTFISSTLAEMSLPSATYTAQFDDLDLINPDGGEQTTLNAINVTATLDPNQIMGTGCLGYWSADQVTQSGTISAMPDKSLRGNDLSSFTSLGYTATNANFTPSSPSADFNGSTSFASIASIAGLSAADPLFLWAISYKNSGNGVNGTLLDYAGTDEYSVIVNTATPGMTFGSTNTTWGSTVVNSAPHLLYTYESGGSSWTQGVCLDCTTTASEVTSSVTSTALASGSTFRIGRRAGGNFFNGSMTDFGLCHVLPTTTQRTNLEVWAHTKRGTP